MRQRRETSVFSGSEEKKKKIFFSDRFEVESSRNKGLR